MRARTVWRAICKCGTRAERSSASHKRPSELDRMEDSCHFPSRFTLKPAGSMRLYSYESVLVWVMTHIVAQSDFRGRVRDDWKLREEVRSGTNVTFVTSPIYFFPLQMLLFAHVKHRLSASFIFNALEIIYFFNFWWAVDIFMANVVYYHVLFHVDLLLEFSLFTIWMVAAGKLDEMNGKVYRLCFFVHIWSSMVRQIGAFQKDYERF